MLSCGRYNERNPLAAGIVPLPWDYAWSSCRFYALGQGNDLRSVNPYYQELGQEAARRQERWRAILLDEDPKEQPIRRQDWLLGEAALQRETRDQRGRPAGRSDGRPRTERKRGTFSAQGEKEIGV